jgi:hypothetical protein
MSGGARTVFANERRIPAYIVSRQHENVLTRHSRNQTGKLVTMAVWASNY